jgi:hypothetical protein
LDPFLELYSHRIDDAVILIKKISTDYVSVAIRACAASGDGRTFNIEEDLALRVSVLGTSRAASQVSCSGFSVHVEKTRLWRKHSPSTSLPTKVLGFTRKTFINVSKDTCSTAWEGFKLQTGWC